MNEIWKPIIGYENSYQISNHGQIRSIERLVNSGLPNTEKQKRKAYMLNPWIQKSNGVSYLRVGLSTNSNKKFINIHRLVAIHFCEGFKEGLVVNHKDGNTLNNHYSNLEWVTQKQNNDHARHVLNKPGGPKGRIALNIYTGIFYDKMMDAYKSKPHKNTYSSFILMLKGNCNNKTDFILI